jgi:SAM-dependent methyltransferase
MIPYKEREIFYTEDGRLMDGEFAVMMDWEKPIMEFQAAQICRMGGDILNVGFGMGFIDGAIEKYQINSHHIIEIHPTVQTEMIKRGWDKKNNVKLHFGDWRDIMDYLPKFDGVYIDTWDEEITDFAKNVHKILKKGGVFSFFNNYKDDFDRDGVNDEMFELLKYSYDIRLESFIIPTIESPEKQTGKSDLAYWWPKDTIYNSPIFILK